jgi:hypothetical protein
MGIILGIVGAAFFTALGGLIIWVASKIAHTHQVSFVRCWLAYLAGAIAGGIAVAMAMGLLRAVGDNPGRPAVILAAAMSFAIEVAVVLGILNGWYLRAAIAFALAVACSCAVQSAMILPALNAANTTARKFEDMNNLKLLGMAMLNYEKNFQFFPHAAICGKDGKPLLSWRVAILPYLDCAYQYKQFKFDEPWDSPHNMKLLKDMPAIYRPVNRDVPANHTCYQVFIQDGKDKPGEGHAPFYADVREGPRLEKFSDGVAHTFLVVEGSQPVPWTKPDDIPYSADRPLPVLGGQFADGFNACFADGTVRFIRGTVSEAVLRALITCDGGEPISAVDLQ